MIINFMQNTKFEKSLKHLFMSKNFISIDPKEIKDNVFKLLDIDKFLITAGTANHFNTMTAGWGGLGSLWYHQVTFCFVRPQRYTFQFTQKYDHYTLCFFDKEFRHVLDFCGNKSGRHVDKCKETGLIPLETESGNIYFEQAKLVIECKKLYAGLLKESEFIDKAVIEKVYPGKDFHMVYIGGIVNCMIEVK
jgi:flavin reductase (DIM6/NTAB) family NADH-FMN oxidoreductase RutF